MAEIRVIDTLRYRVFDTWIYRVIDTWRYCVFDTWKYRVIDTWRYRVFLRFELNAQLTSLPFGRQLYGPGVSVTFNPAHHVTRRHSCPDAQGRAEGPGFES